MTLYELLRPIQDMKIELHIYKNHTTKLDNEGKVIPSKVVAIITEDSTSLFVNFSLKRYGKELDAEKLNVFYIGHSKVSNRSRILRVNCEVMED